MRVNFRLSQITILLAFIFAGTAVFGQSIQSMSAIGALTPPAGAKVALVVFEDLQCPECARAAPIVVQASERYSIPVVRYNYPLPQHNWAMDAAVIAEYFEGKSPKLGVEFREFVFKNQAKITKPSLRRLADQFAQQHSTALPFVLDPQGKLAAAVQQDRALGEKVGIKYTPTLYVVSKTSKIEVTDRSQLFRIIEQVIATAGS